jgi:hypothetical protein
MPTPTGQNFNSRPREGATHADHRLPNPHHPISAQGNLFSLSVALFQAFEMAVFLPFITIILFFQNFRYHSGIMNEYQRTY